MVGIKTDVEGYVFDAFLKLDHERRLTITDHPVEEGASITDHSFVEPKAISMEIGMSDVGDSIIDGQFAHRSTRSISAFDTLCRLQAARKPITVNTKLARYENMLIENIASPDDFKTMNGLMATVFFREIIIVSADTAALPNRTSKAPQKTGSTTKGAVQPSGAGSEGNRSALRRAADALRGGL